MHGHLDRGWAIDETRSVRSQGDKEQIRVDLSEKDVNADRSLVCNPPVIDRNVDLSSLLYCKRSISLSVEWSDPSMRMLFELSRPRKNQEKIVNGCI